MANDPNHVYIEAARQNFVMLCLDALQRGYERMVADAQYNVCWKEDKLTAHLVKKMEETSFLNKKQIDIHHQSPVYDSGITDGEDDPANAPVIDFKFVRWNKLRKVCYYAEAKTCLKKIGLKRMDPKQPLMLHFIAVATLTRAFKTFFPIDTRMVV